MNRSRLTRFARYAIAAHAAVLALAWSAVVAAPPGHDDSSQSISLPGVISLADLVELAGQRLGISVQYEREALNKQITLRLNDEVSPSELWHVVTSVLASHGFVAIETERDNLFRVVTLTNAPTESRRTIELAQDQRLADFTRASFVTVLARLQSIEPSRAVKEITPLLTPNTGSVKPMDESGAVLISDVTTRVERAIELIRAIDSPVDPMKKFTVDLERSSATELARQLEQVFSLEVGGRAAPLGAAASAPPAGSPRVIALADDRRVLVMAPTSRESAIRALITELDARESRETRSYSASGVAASELAEAIRLVIDTSSSGSVTAGADRPRVTAEKLTGTVLVTATAREHARASQLVEEINNAPPGARRTVRSFVVVNRDAQELSQTLLNLLSTTRDTLAAPLSDAAVVGGKAASSSTPDPATSTSNPRRADRIADSGSPAISLTVDEPTNTIIASGEPAAIAQVERLLRELDRRQPQVMIEVSLVTLSDSQALNLGVELRQQFQRGRTEFDLASLFGLAANSGSDALAAGTGFTGTILRPGDFEIVVRALESVNRGRTLSIPKVLVNNNAKATLRSVNRQPFTSINASDTVSTTSFGGTEDAGTTVTVEPRISPADHLALAYTVELSAFTGQPTTVEGGGVIPPPSQQNSVEGSVTLPDGFTVVVGGLTNLSDTTSNSRLPILGSIPILGALFGTTSDSNSQARFYVFIRSTIVRDPLFQDLRQLSSADIGTAKLDPDTPDLAPLWME